MLVSFICWCLVLDTGSGHQSPEDFRVHGLSAVEPAFASFEGEMFAGLISARADAELFFWLLTCSDSDSLVIWFNGGPGCSSIDAGMLFEMGPVTTPLHPAGYDNSLHGNHNPLTFNQYAWSNVTNILYLEQPVGVGYSVGSPPPQNEQEVAADFYRFLQHFYEIFPGMRQFRLFLVGESYAGMYVPSMAHYIHEQSISNSKNPKINLKGIGIGNGWVDAVTQGPAVIDYAWWHGMIDTVYKDALWDVWSDCVDGKSLSSPFHPFTVPDECGIMSAVLQAAGAQNGRSPNTYDVTTWDDYAVLTSNNGTFAKLLNKPEVKKALNVGHVKKEWMGCLPGAGRRKLNMLDNDEPVSMAGYIANLLDNTDIHVLVYNGDDDMSTCSQGSELFLNGMVWNGQSNWLDPSAYSRGLWKVNGKVAGHAKSVNNLHFLVVYNSGHLVPYNQPINSLDMIKRLTNGSPHFVDQEIPFVLDQYRASRGRDTKRFSSHIGLLTHLVSAALGCLVGIAIMWINSKHSKQQGYAPVPTHQ